MQTLLLDLRYASRQLWTNWGFTLLVVLTVSLGIGANTAIFSMVNGFHKPLPVPNPDQIVVLAAQTKGDETGLGYRLSFLQVQDLRRQATQFSDVFGGDINQGGMSISGHAYPFVYTFVTGNFFTGLGVVPALGRLFRPGEGEAPGGDVSMVLSYGFWQKHLGGRADIIGQQIRLDGIAARVIGITPPEFHGVYEGLDPEGYVPLSNLNFKGLFTDRDRRSLTTFARLKPGVSIRQAQSSLDVVTARLEQQYPATDKGISIRIIPEPDARPVPLGSLTERLPAIRTFALLLAAVVLLLACMNVANLLLVRGTVRQRELAIRAALGSGRARLIRQALTESLLLALLGAAGGLILGKWASDGFAASIDLATDFPTLLDFSFDWRVFSYALAAAVVTGLLIGLWPALASVRDGSRRGAARWRARRFRRTRPPARAQHAGDRTGGRVAGAVDHRRPVHAQLAECAESEAGFRSRPSAQRPHGPGVGRLRPAAHQGFLSRAGAPRQRPARRSQSASFALQRPHGLLQRRADRIHRRTPARSGPAAAGHRLQFRGPVLFRDAAEPASCADAPSPKPTMSTRRWSAIVNQTMAARYWPNQDPLGKRFRTNSPDAPLVQVVGVAEDGKYLSVSEAQLPYFYMPLAQNYMSMRVLQVRSQAARRKN